MSRKRLFGLVVSILLGVLALPGTIDDLESWKRWISSVSDWASENPGDVVRTILVLAAILVFGMLAAAAAVRRALRAPLLPALKGS